MTPIRPSDRSFTLSNFKFPGEIKADRSLLLKIVTVVALGALGLLAYVITTSCAKSTPMDKQRSNGSSTSANSSSSSNSSSSTTSSSSASSNSSHQSESKNTPPPNVHGNSASLSSSSNSSSSTISSSSVSSSSSHQSESWVGVFPQITADIFDYVSSLSLNLTHGMNDSDFIRALETATTSYARKTYQKVRSSAKKCEIDGKESSAFHVELVGTQKFIASEWLSYSTSDITDSNIGWSCISEYKIPVVISLNSWSFATANAAQSSLQIDAQTTDISAALVSNYYVNLITKHQTQHNDNFFFWTKIDVQEWNENKSLPEPQFNDLVNEVEKLRSQSEADPYFLVNGNRNATGTLIVACTLKELSTKGMLTVDNYHNILLTLVLSYRAQTIYSRQTISEAQIKSLLAYSLKLIRDNLI